MSMAVDKDIEKIARPILDQLQEFMNKSNPEEMVELPHVRFMREPLKESIWFDDVEITEEFIQRLEEYIQDELEMMHKPTILH